jgi:hypothetical protein
LDGYETWKQELVALSIRRKEDEYIERLVLPTDTLQGIALLYNTSVSYKKKYNDKKLSKSIIEFFYLFV